MSTTYKVSNTGIGDGTFMENHKAMKKFTESTPGVKLTSKSMRAMCGGFTYEVVVPAAADAAFREFVAKTRGFVLN